MIKEKINKAKRKVNIGIFILKLIPILILGIIHLVEIIFHFDFIIMNYAIICFLLALANVWLFAIERLNAKPNMYVAGIISVVLIIIIMSSSLSLTILRTPLNFKVLWMIAGYIIYVLFRLAFSISRLSNKKKKSDRGYVSAYIGLLGALYALQMMIFRITAHLIKDLNNMPLGATIFLSISQGLIIIFALVVVILFIKKAIEYKNRQPIVYDLDEE